jgi:transcription antitermination factor NusG
LFLFLKYTRYVENVKNKLLKKYKKTFINVNGVGYIIITPSEQLREAERILKKETNKIINKSQNLYKHTDYSRVSLEEKKRANDNQAIAGNILAMTRSIK